MLFWGGSSSLKLRGLAPNTHLLPSSIPSSLSLLPSGQHSVFDVICSLVVSCTVQNETKQCQLLSIYELFSFLHWHGATSCALVECPSKASSSYALAETVTVQAKLGNLKHVKLFSSSSSDSDSKAGRMIDAYCLGTATQFSSPCRPSAGKERDMVSDFNHFDP